MQILVKYTRESEVKSNPIINWEARPGSQKHGSELIPQHFEVVLTASSNPSLLSTIVSSFSCLIIMVSIFFNITSLATFTCR
jgi:hypothetical protein